VHPGSADLCPEAPFAFFTRLAHALHGVDNVGRLLFCHKMYNEDTDNTPIVRRMGGEANRTFGCGHCLDYAGVTATVEAYVNGNSKQ